MFLLRKRVKLWDIKDGVRTKCSGREEERKTWQLLPRAKLTKRFLVASLLGEAYGWRKDPSIHCLSGLAWLYFRSLPVPDNGLVAHDATLDTVDSARKFGKQFFQRSKRTVQATVRFRQRMG